jgi:hypothetical protein
MPILLLWRFDFLNGRKNKRELKPEPIQIRKKAKRYIKNPIQA